MPPGGEYPLDVPPTGAAALAAVQKWGQAIKMTDEEVARNRYAGDAVDRNLLKVVNSIIKQVDGVALSAIGSTVTATQAAAASWSGGSPKILQDVELAIAKVEDLNMGYVPDTILVSSTKYAYLASDPVIAALRRRETTDNPVYSGDIETIAGLVVLKAPLSSLPGGIDSPWIFDSKQIGGMADEEDNAPGYTVAEMAVQVQTKRMDENDGWKMWGRRKTVPVVQEPGAGIQITGT